MTTKSIIEQAETCEKLQAEYETVLAECATYSLFSVPAELREKRDHAEKAWQDAGAELERMAAVVKGMHGICVGDRVCGGQPGTEDYDEGYVLDVDGDLVDVGWDSGVRTVQIADGLEVIEVFR